MTAPNLIGAPRKQSTLPSDQNSDCSGSLLVPMKSHSPSRHRNFVHLQMLACCKDNCSHDKVLKIISNSCWIVGDMSLLKVRCAYVPILCHGNNNNCQSAPTCNNSLVNWQCIVPPLSECSLAMVDCHHQPCPEKLWMSVPSSLSKTEFYQKPKSFVSRSHMNCCLQIYYTSIYIFYRLFTLSQSEKFKNYKNPSSTSKVIKKT